MVQCVQAMDIAEEMPQDKIAIKLDCPVGTVKSRLFKARKLLYEDLKDLVS